MKQGEPNDLLVYKKALRKELDEYVKTTPPQVKAGRKLVKEKGSLDSNIIKYVILRRKGPVPVELYKKGRGRIDYEHYIQKQIKPIANSVLEFYDTNFYDVIRESEQKELDEF